MFLQPGSVQVCTFDEFSASLCNVRSEWARMNGDPSLQGTIGSAPCCPGARLFIPKTPQIAMEVTLDDIVADGVTRIFFGWCVGPEPWYTHVFRLPRGEGLPLVPLCLNASMNCVSTTGLKLCVFAGVIVSGWNLNDLGVLFCCVFKVPF